MQYSNTVFLDQQSFEVISDQWSFLASIKKISLERLDSLYMDLVKNDTSKIDQSSVKITLKSNNELQIKIKNMIYISKESIKPHLIDFIRENLNFINTEYLVKERMGISTYKMEKYFKLIKEDTDFISLPRGFLETLTKYMDEQHISYEVIHERHQKQSISFSSKVELYPYQKNALEAIVHYDQGVIVAPPGSGKTIMGLELIAIRKQKALIIVHRKQLLDQWVERIESFLGIPKKDIGKIGDGKKTIGKEVTIAMMQSLIKLNDIEIEELDKTIGTIIIDECHHIPAKTFREVIVKFNPYYLYGLTATPKRKFNDEKLIYFYIGDIIATIDVNQITQRTNELEMKGKIELFIRNTSLSVPFDKKVDMFETLSKVLIFDSSRNTTISEDILKQIKGGKKVLVLTERKEHVDVLNLYLKIHCETTTLSGNDSSIKRKVKLKQLSEGNFQVLIATGQLLGEGFDLPILDCLFLVYPFSFEGKLIQYIGRIQRSKKGKVIVDYADINIPIFTSMFKKRKAYYRRNGWI